MPAVTADCTPEPDPDLVLFLAIADSGDFDRLARLCDERLLYARDDAATLRWRKDRAIVEAMRGRFLAAYHILREAYYLAARFEGTARGKYHNELGLVLIELGRPASGLEQFDHAERHHLIDGSVKSCAEVWHNRGRAYAAQGEHAKASPYFKRALDYARAENDFRLEMEVLESLIEYGVRAG